jgi:hypothetical protein
MEKIIYPLNDEQTHFLEVFFEWFTEYDTRQDWPEINSVSLDGLMVIKIDEMPKELRQAIINYIYEKR